MKRAELVGVDTATRASVDSLLTGIDTVQSLAQSIADNRAAIEEASTNMNRMDSLWLPPQGFLWAVTSNTNCFDIVLPRKFGFSPLDGFSRPVTTRDFEPRPPETPEDRYTFLADFLKTASPYNYRPGALYADGSFANERLAISGTEYEIGVIAVNNMPELIANGPVEGAPNRSLLKEYGRLTGLTIEPKSVAA